MSLILDPASLPRPLDFAELFGRQAPVEIEIGFGKGRSLLGDAAARPLHDFIGIELAAEYLRLVARRAERRGLGNLRLVGADAGEFLREYVPASALVAVTAYCPDPWPKKRHHKRRLFTYGFVVAIAQALATAGRFRFVSDHQAYFEEVLGHVVDAVEFDSPTVSMRRPADGVESARTNYERKWLLLGRPVYTLEAERISPSQ